ncbi:hypothetical protein DM02DRAFT_722056 [Periconia macrospinosa]|uniref:SPX domain-containing protein n=1 Tax=Periconia macrospinosa TaxID=97972 RepID=A0A2V1D3C4_9PLEO|nr:hypothetical protein DM02DRAFT_722056 [Periconia macrospinosa]
MKYGSTLRQHSVSEWEHFNIDYDYLKGLIKQQTTPGTSKDVSISGQEEITDEAFGDTFYKALKAQHDRISLFIRSKSGEIERRLEHIGRNLEQLQNQHASEGPTGRLLVRVVEMYAKIDADVTRKFDHSRFEVAQRTGFSKILKKYKRWTKDTWLEHHFSNAVANSPDSFYQLDLEYLMRQYIDVLTPLRTLFNAPDASPAPVGANGSLSTARISQTAQNGTELDFDLALSIIPLGSCGRKATYWIHTDHIVEVQVLLLQQMHLYPGPNATASPILKDSLETTPKRRKNSTNVHKFSGGEDCVGIIVLDHPESFAIKHNTTTVASSEETVGTSPAKAAGNARWTCSTDAAVAVGLDQASEDVTIAKLKRKHLAAFLDTSVFFKDRKEPALRNRQNGNGDEDLKANITATRQWLMKHKEVRPIAGICSKRTRFVGLHNNSAGGIWATMDRDVFMKDSLHKDLNDEDRLFEARISSAQVPHAVLEVRCEGNHSAALIQTLDRTHLVERLHGFSLEKHAVWACCKLSAMSTPFWVPLLDKDIKKLPLPVGRQRRKANSAFTSRNVAFPATSTNTLVEPMPLQACRKKPKPYSEYPPFVQLQLVRRSYWNEYDNVGPEDEGYYIYVDSETSDKFPSQEYFEAWVVKARKLFGIRGAPEAVSGLSTVHSSGDETVEESYGTFAVRDPHRRTEILHTIRQETERERRSLLNEIQQDKAEMPELYLHSACLAMAVILNVMMGMMAMTNRKKERGVIDTVIQYGSPCNFLLCTIGVISMKARGERKGWLHQSVVLLVAIGNVLVDVLLLTWVFHGP